MKRHKITSSILAILLVTALLFTMGCKPEGNDEENNGINVKVSTSTPWDITATSAMCGGNVTINQGYTLDELGVCWSTNHVPTVNDDHLSTVNWNESFVCSLTGLQPLTNYYVCAYALHGLDYYYGDIICFTTDLFGGVSGNYNGYDYVDLGLPSGTLWATCNVGANIHSGFGDYYAWGEIQPKTTYNWNTYKYCHGSHDQLTKYCHNSDYGYQGYRDNLYILEPEDDAATVQWGNGWRTPTKEEWEELYRNTTSFWTTQNGNNGVRFMASNGNWLFIPAAGYRYNSELHNTNNTYISYWTNRLDRGVNMYMSSPGAAFCYVNYQSYFGMNNFGRCHGLSVRAVCTMGQK